MKNVISLFSLAALVMLPGCVGCCKKDSTKAKTAQTTSCNKPAAKKDTSYGKSAKPADKKAATKKADPKKQQDSKKKYSLVNPAASKAQRVQFEEIPQLPLV